MFANDLHRPRYHFLPPANWMNDPNGPIFWRGEYHLFYQYNPFDATWGGKSGANPTYDTANREKCGTMHWGHAVSSDLVHWEHWPVALAPTPNGPDKDGVFSGCAVDDDNVPTLIYTGVSPEVQCLATSSDGLRTWHKDGRNPVLVAHPPGLDLTGFRDPCVWRESGEWKMLIGSGIKDAGGTALLYSSLDLVKWHYVGPLCVGRHEETGTVWECPDFFSLKKASPPSGGGASGTGSGKWGLLVSPIPIGKTLWLTGRYDGRTFTPEKRGTLDFGNYYAAKSFRGGNGRQIVWGWITEGRNDHAQRAAGWSGAMSLPRELTTNADGTLHIAPVKEVEILRGAHRHYDHKTAEDAAALTGHTEFADRQLELIAEFSDIDHGQAGFILHRDSLPDNSEETRIYYDTDTKRLICDRTKSSHNAETNRDEQSGSLTLAPGERLRLRVFVDRSVIEVYANDRACLTTRVYPTSPTADGIGLHLAGKARLVSLDVWAINAIF